MYFVLLHFLISPNIIDAVVAEKVEMTSQDSTYANFTANFTFPRDKIEIKTELGHGAFGKVLLAKANGIMGIPGETDVAVKTLKG